MSMAASKQWTRVRTLGRGTSGAEVFLAVDDASGELFAVKSACASGAGALRREQAIMSALRSPRVVSCIGGRGGRDGSYQLFLEFAPGGSLADEAARNGGLEERPIRAYMADVAAGLAYIHGVGMVHGDMKAGTAADVWALGCMVIEMATGRAPWTGMDGDALVAMHRIGYTDAVPEVPQWLSAEAKDFLAGCASDRFTAAQLLQHPFLASAAGSSARVEDVVKSKWVSPKSTLDAAFWVSESDTEEADDELSHNTVERIKTLAGSASAQLLQHPLLASAVSSDVKLEDVVKSKWWVSPKSTLDAAFWESGSDSEEADDELSHSTSEED